jgi:hypothetical protein
MRLAFAASGALMLLAACTSPQKQPSQEQSTMHLPCGRLRRLQPLQRELHAGRRQPALRACHGHQNGLR